MTQKTCDLHTHTYYSDGTLSPAQLISEAQRAGLSAVALTDHNTVRGLAEFHNAAKGTGIITVSGTELTSVYCGKELHVLGLFIPDSALSDIQKFGDDFNNGKKQSNIELADALNRGGYAIDFEKIQRENQHGYINRAHFAIELTRLGYTKDRTEAFNTILSADGGYYTPPKRTPTLQVIEMLRDLGAIPVLAHPFLNLDEKLLLELLPKAISCGLCGMETLYAKYSPEQTAAAEQIASDFGLLRSGGSDFHGSNKPDTRIGVGRGDLCVPFELFDRMREFSVSRGK